VLSPTRRAGHRDGGEAGSTLMLLPAAVLVVLLLAAIAVDLSAVRLGRRELVHAAASAANDAVTAGLDEDRLRRGDGYRLDARRVEQVVLASLAAQQVLDDLATPPAVAVDGTTVTVTLTGRVDHVFAKALPGAPDHTRVRARASASVSLR
jgi:putative component of toxin-antitoxin plasmid stabilization module